MTLFKKVYSKSKIGYFFVFLLFFQGCQSQDKKNEKDIEEIQKNAGGYTNTVSYSNNVDFRLAARIATPGVVNIKSTFKPQNHQYGDENPSDFYDLPDSFKDFFREELI